MAPRKMTVEDQQKEPRQTLENFTTGLHDALQHAVENALTMVLQTQHEQHNQQMQYARRDGRRNVVDDEEENVFTDGGFLPRHHPHEGDRQVRVIPNTDQGANNRWENEFCFDIHEFTGTLNPEEFLDWLNMVEEILEFKRVSDDMRVPLVATRLKNRASAWWSQLKESRRRFGKAKIKSWEGLKKHMHRGFLPYNYGRTLYNKLQNLRQGPRTVDEYALDFSSMITQTTLLETEEQLLYRFIGGLRTQLQIPLQQFNHVTVFEAHQRALGMELQYKKSWTSSSRARPQAQQSNESGFLQVADTTTMCISTSKPTTLADSIAASRQPRNGALRCFSCGETGHRQTSCPNQHKRGLLAHDTEFDGEVRYDNYASDSNEQDENLIHGDTGHVLVLRRNFLC